MNFKDLGLKDNLVEALSSLKFTEPFEVQQKIIPLAMKGKNIAFTSKTGSGKTLAFTVGFLNKINTKLGVQMLVLVPTRELCIQVTKEIKKICSPLKINVGALYGGREISGDYKTLKKKNQIIVGTPGRLIQHINSTTLKIGDTKYLIFDESDHMFDDGFYGACVYVKERCSKNVQIILSSATMTGKVNEFVEFTLRDYELLKIGSNIPKNITQEKIYCEKSDKNKLILDFLKNKKFKRGMIFCNTKIKVDAIAKFLSDNKYNTAPITGDLTQDERTQTLNLFKEGKIRLIVTTDVTARGIHVDKVSLIINYDIPTRSEFYVHRIGRSGRTNNRGYALSLICPEDEERILNIESEFTIDIKELDYDFTPME